MPRLDNGHEEVIRAFDLDFNEDDPGATRPIDVCWGCYEFYGWDKVADLCLPDHPNYDDSHYNYHCAHCKAPLTGVDN